MQRYSTPRRGMRLPPRIVRRTTYLRRSLGSALRAGRLLRSLGAPPMKHVISRPGRVLQITDINGAINVNGAIASTSGLTEGLQSAGRGAGPIVQTINFGLSQVFQFSFLQTPSDLSGLYDNYRIKAVKLRFDLSFNQAPSSAPTQGGVAMPNIASMPMIHYCIDPDDITCPTSTSQVLQYSKSRSVRMGDKPLFITLQPRAQGTAASNVTTSGTTGLPTSAVVANMLSTNTWFDAVNGQTIPHFGLKMFFEHMPIGILNAGQTNWVLTICPTYILEVKNIH